MSAATWDIDCSTAPAPARLPLTLRRHLTLVPGSAVSVEPAPRGRVRLTRWGRLALTLSLLVAAITIATALVAGGPAAPAGPAVIGAVTVDAGQTLSDIAATELPSLPIREGVARLQLANNLSSSAVHAGQSLQIPAS